MTNQANTDELEGFYGYPCSVKLPVKPLTTKNQRQPLFAGDSGELWMECPEIPDERREECQPQDESMLKEDSKREIAKYGRRSCEEGYGMYHSCSLKCQECQMITAMETFFRPALERALEQGRHPRILDVGVGCGDSLSVYRKHYGSQIQSLGLDIKPENIQWAREKHSDGSNNVFCALNARCVDLVGGVDQRALFDGAIALSIFTHLEKDEVCPTFLRMLDKVRPGSPVIVTYLMNKRGVNKDLMKDCLEGRKQSIDSWKIMDDKDWIGFHVEGGLPLKDDFIWSTLAVKAEIDGEGRFEEANVQTLIGPDHWRRRMPDSTSDMPSVSFFVPFIMVILHFILS